MKLSNDENILRRSPRVRALAGSGVLINFSYVISVREVSFNSLNQLKSEQNESKSPNAFLLLESLNYITFSIDLVLIIQYF